jgi:RNA polymerase sigma-70 factor (ECF subfamily)
VTTDRTTITRRRAGIRLATATLAVGPNHALDEHSRYLFGYAMKLLRDPHLAGDAVQDTFVAALASDTPFAGRSAMRTWLVGILKHKIADAFRARSRAPVSLDAIAEQGLDGIASAWQEAGAVELGPAGPASEPETAAALRRFRESCAEQFDRMPARIARAFLLSAVLGHDTEEVGRMLGVSDANVWTMVSRARLRAALQPPLAA